MINAVSNSQVPHLTVTMGASYGAGNYGMCGPRLRPALAVHLAQRQDRRDGPAAAGRRDVDRRPPVGGLAGTPYDEEADAAMRALVEDADRSGSRWPCS